MANRPVFVVSLDRRYCIRENVEFQFFSGFSDKQQKKSIQSLHQVNLVKHADINILEISSKSENELGVRLSAFHLMIRTADGKEFSVESAFQASKIFENGGPYKNLLNVTPKQAKRDERLKTAAK